MKILSTKLINLLLLTAPVFLFSRSGRADTIYDREALDATRSIAILAPVFYSDLTASTNSTVKETPRTAPKQPMSGRQTKKQSKSKQKPLASPFYQQTHRTLTETMRSALPGFLSEGGRFAIIPAGLIQKTLQELHWQTRDLFLSTDNFATQTTEQNSFKRLNSKSKKNFNDKKDRRSKKGPKFPLPDTQRVQQLARRLHVDAVFLGVMREPASIAEGVRLPYEIWRVNPLHLDVRHTRAHVLSPRIQASLITEEGVIAWQDEQMADHPRSVPRNQHTLLLDWQEATEQAAQQLAGSLLTGH